MLDTVCRAVTLTLYPEVDFTDSQRPRVQRIGGAHDDFFACLHSADGRVRRFRSLIVGRVEAASCISFTCVAEFVAMTLRAVLGLECAVRRVEHCIVKPGEELVCLPTCLHSQGLGKNNMLRSGDDMLLGFVQRPYAEAQGWPVPLVQEWVGGWVGAWVNGGEG